MGAATTDCALAAAVLAVAWLAFSATAYPDVAPGDSGELVGSVCAGGVPHPPGYPLYAVLGSLLLGAAGGPAAIGSPAALLHQAAAVQAALAAAVLAVALRRLVGAYAGASGGTALQAVAAGAAALAVSLARTAWQYSTHAEVFALNNALVAALLLAAVAFAERPSFARALVGAFLCGLGLTNQHTFVLLAAPLMLHVAYAASALPASTRAPPLLRGRHYAALAGAFSAPLLLYGVLAWRGAAAPPGSWGATRSASGLLSHVLRREYGTFSLALEAERASFVSNTAHYAAHLWEQLSPLGVATAAAGVALHLAAHGRAHAVGPARTLLALSGGARDGRRRMKAATGAARPGRTTGKRAEAAQGGAAGDERAARRARMTSLTSALLGAYLFYLCFFHALANLSPSDALQLGVMARFWIQPDMLLAVPLALAVRSALSRASRLGSAPAAAACAVVVCLVAAHGAVGYAAADHSDGVYVGAFGRAVLDAAPPGAVVLGTGDAVFTALHYLQRCEGVRPDVRALDLHHMSAAWFAGAQHGNYPGVAFPAARYDPAAAAHGRAAGAAEDGRPSAYDMRAFLEANAALVQAGAVVFVDGWWAEDTSCDGVFELVRCGAVQHVVRAAGAAGGARRPADGGGAEARSGAERTPLDVWEECAEERRRLESLPVAPARYGERTWERTLAETVWSWRVNAAQNVLQWSASLGVSRRDERRRALEGGVAHLARTCADDEAAHASPYNAFVCHTLLCHARYQLVAFTRTAAVDLAQMGADCRRAAALAPPGSAEVEALLSAASNVQALLSR